MSKKKENYNQVVDKQRDEIKTNLEKKDYLLTIYQTGDETFSLGDWDRKVAPRRFYATCSLSEIPDYLKWMEQPFWTHPDLENSKVKSSDIPFEEKKWGIYYNIIIEPLSEELEKSYIDASKKDFFAQQRMFNSRKSEIEK